MVSLYFGLPGCGKTTLLAKHALKYVRSKRYKNVYSNVPLSIPGVIYIGNSDVGHFNLVDGVVLIDEASIFADSREFKTFEKTVKDFFLLHRHYGLSIELFCQQWDAVDKRIRSITDRVYYLYKPRSLARYWLTRYYRIPYGIIIPDKGDNGEKLGDIVQGYCKPNFLVRLFAHRLYRPFYYKYFDSWAAPDLPLLPVESCNKQILLAVESFKPTLLSVE